LLLLPLGPSACASTRVMDVRAFPSTKRAVSELQRDLADAVVGDYPVMAFEARESAGRFEVAGRPFGEQKLGIGLSKGAGALNAAVTDALRRVMQDGTYLDILIKWGVAAGKIESPPATAQVPKPEEVPELGDGNLKVGMEVSYPPMEFMDETKREAGVDVELAAALGKALGVEAVVVDMPFDALIEAVETGKIDIIISAMTVTENRTQRVDFIPYLQAGYGILVKKGNPKQIRKVGDLCGRVVAVQSATSQFDLLKAQICQ
jgi:ABC-type amino acid transport substrate-binding protein